MLTLVLILVVLAAVLESLSVKDPLRRVTYEVSPSKPAVDPGEAFELISVARNYRRMPVPFVHMKEDLPKEIQILDSKAVTGSSPTHLILESKFYLMPRQGFTRRVPVSLPQRGLYSCTGALLGAGDFLGIKTTWRRFSLEKEIVVLPAPAHCPAELEAVGGFLGDVSVRRFLMEDPVLTLGFREYTGREPMKSIAWTQSARFGQLMVKKYDYTLEPSVRLILNVECPPEEADPEGEVERCLSLTRSVCEKLEEMRVKYSFLTNVSIPGTARSSQMEEGLGPDHLMGILEGLGRASCLPVEKVDVLLERAAHQTQTGGAHILVTPRWEAARYEKALERLREMSGGQILVLHPEREVED